jgi:hypothetical protein
VGHPAGVVTRRSNPRPFVLGISVWCVYFVRAGNQCVVCVFRAPGPRRRPRPRQVYLPMSFIYGTKATGPITPTVLALRSEIFVTPYQSIDWNKARFEVSLHDLYSPHTWLCDRVFDALRVGPACDARPW